jgi:hypothetical protein
MPQHDTQVELQALLVCIIDKMKALQRQIASDSQPASMHELDALAKLGTQYANIIEKLRVVPQ